MRLCSGSRPRMPPARSTIVAGLPDDLVELCMELLDRDPTRRADGAADPRAAAWPGRADRRHARDQADNPSDRPVLAPPGSGRRLRLAGELADRDRLRLRPDGNGQDHAGAVLSRRADRGGRSRRAGGPVLRAGVGAVQGGRQPGRCAGKAPEGAVSDGPSAAASRRRVPACSRLPRPPRRAGDPRNPSSGLRSCPIPRNFGSASSPRFASCSAG